jgi:ribosomal protein S27E
MAAYNLVCKECSDQTTIMLSISEFQSHNKTNFLNLKCKSCGSNNIGRIYGNISSKISRSSEEIVAQVREDARNIVEKVKQGDIHAIRDVYGEGD